MKLSLEFLIVVLVLVLAQTSCSKKTAQLSAQLAEIRAKAEQGDAKAQYELGRCYTKIYGLSQVGPDRFGLKEDDVEAVKWFRKSAEQGYAPAQVEMGERCRWGRGVVTDRAEAIRWYTKGADQNDHDAQWYLFVSADNCEEAYKWLIILSQKNSNQDLMAQTEAKMTPEQIAEGKRRADEWLVQHKKPPANP
jgi:TPR repeat protein